MLVRTGGWEGGDGEGFVLRGVKSQWMAQHREKCVPIYILGLVIFLPFSVLYQLLLESLFSGLGKHLPTVIHIPGS